MLVAGWWLSHSEKYDFVTWDDDIPDIWENNLHVPNQQPESYWFTGKKHFLYQQSVSTSVGISESQHWKSQQKMMCPFFYKLPLLHCQRSLSVRKINSEKTVFFQFGGLSKTFGEKKNEHYKFGTEISHFWSIHDGSIIRPKLTSPSSFPEEKHVQTFKHVF